MNSFRTCSTISVVKEHLVLAAAVGVAVVTGTVVVTVEPLVAELARFKLIWLAALAMLANVMGFLRLFAAAELSKNEPIVGVVVLAFDVVVAVGVDGNISAATMFVAAALSTMIGYDEQEIVAVVVEEDDSLLLLPPHLG